MMQTSLREQFLQCMERKKAEKEKLVNPVEISETAKEPVAPEPEQEAPKKLVRRRRRKILDDDDD